MERVLFFNNKKALKKAIQIIESGVKTTLGPSGSTAIIASRDYTVNPDEGLHITKDGLTVLDEIRNTIHIYGEDGKETLDQAVRVYMSLLCQSSKEVAERVGDGTTTAAILTCRLLDRMLTSGLHYRDMEKMLHEELNTILRNVDRVKPTRKVLRNIATTSLNGNKAIGELLADEKYKIGSRGRMSYVRHSKTYTEVETARGFSYPGEFHSTEFRDSPTSPTATFEARNAKVLMFEDTVKNIKEVAPAINRAGEVNVPLVIMAPALEMEVIQQLKDIKNKYSIRICLITPPDFGDEREASLDDLQLVLGGQILGFRKSNKLTKENVDSVLATVDLITVTQDKITIIRDNPEYPDDIKTLVKNLEDNLSLSDNKEFLQKRIARLTGGISTVKVGGETDAERDVLWYAIEDAVKALESASREGAVLGGGTALKDAIGDKRGILFDSIRDLIGILFESSLYDNKMEEFFTLPKGYGVNLYDGTIGDMRKKGIVDCYETVELSLKTAIITALNLYSSNLVIGMTNMEPDNY